jgi:hypothetical protein
MPRLRRAPLPLAFVRRLFATEALLNKAQLCAFSAATGLGLACFALWVSSRPLVSDADLEDVEVTVKMWEKHTFPDDEDFDWVLHAAGRPDTYVVRWTEIAERRSLEKLDELEPPGSALALKAHKDRELPWGHIIHEMRSAKGLRLARAFPDGLARNSQMAFNKKMGQLVAAAFAGFGFLVALGFLVAFERDHDQGRFDLFR